ncbi:aspartate aminotransferase family protein [Vibrio sp. S9_S30]|uniref:aspartate aminotransferase family protein n=1 Tax=Vibrio sp. S9_S30 TaxID=2720226 RepID=UPI0016817191|nr:aspartate aminotransferase family protein [Vibrio sp. S9_S30]MBD1558151.1 aspartate aminotransferase family protein [Vibrio sp. S9_S30]
MKKANNILDNNAFDLTSSDNLDAKMAKMVKRRLNTVGPTAMLFYQEPLHIVRGKGAWLYDSNGSQYLDVYNNVPSIGHCHPKVVNAISNQVRKLNIHTRYLHENVHVYTERLLGTLPDSIDRLIMTCTGSESNDLALRLARSYTGKTGIIVTEAAYHGNTSAVTEVSPSALKSRALPDYVATVAIDNLNQTNQTPEDVFLHNVQSAIAKLNSKGYGCAALLADSIFSSDGVYSHPVGFLKKAVEEVQRQGGLFIADEVQPGFGRTGESMWGFERHDVLPDIVTMGKPMANGYPVAGVAARLDLLEILSEEAGYFNTFGGSPVAAAAGLAVLDVIEEERLISKSLSVGRYLKDGLVDLQNTYSEISEVRGSGLFIGVEFCRDQDKSNPNTELANTIMNLLKHNKVLIGGAGKYGNTLKIRPPLCFNKTHADLFLKKMNSALKQAR